MQTPVSRNASVEGLNMIDHKLRRQCITSTDVGPIFGVDAYRDAFEVWTEKHGHAPPWEPTPRMLLGKDLEQGIMQSYSRITGRPVVWNDRTMQNPTRQWMAASADAFVFRGEVLERVVDSKLVFWDQRRKWGPTANDMPEGVQLQLWWQMAVMECDVSDVVAWVGEDAPRIYEIERNREAERVVVAKCEEWHRRYVVGDEIPPISGSEASAAWLQQAFPHHKRPDMRQATEEEIALLESYALVRELQQTATSRRHEMENEIKLAIGDREGLEWPDGKFTWRRTQGKTTINWKALGTHLLLTRIKEEEEREALRAEYTKVEPGTRRIHFVCDALDISDAA
jgi:predicted phage-related endonuclease